MERVLEVTFPKKIIVSECSPSHFRARHPHDDSAYGYGFTKEDAVKDLISRNPRFVVITDTGMKIEELSEKEA
jgi:hypothetical protein